MLIFSNHEKTVNLLSNIFYILALWVCLPAISIADSIEEAFQIQYPADRYIVGVGQAKLTKNRSLDERIATITARALVAQNIKVRIKQEFLVTSSCEGNTGRLFGKKLDCHNTVVSTIEQTVDEILVGANSVKTGIEDGRVYSVVVFPIGASEKIEESIENTILHAKESLKSAKNGGEHYTKARDDYLKAKMLSEQYESVSGVRIKANKAFQEMESELINLR